MKVYTIGFTKKAAERFFTTLRDSSARRVVDVRLHNVSQLAGFAKRDDLRYFLREIGGLDYVHLPELAPSPALFEAYRKRGRDWDTYARGYLALLQERHVEDTIPRELIADGCLLCSEDTPHRCHRRLAAEYLAERWGNLEIVHLA